MRVTELCSYCGTETEITDKGGHCRNCGRFLKPCSQCDMDNTNCEKDCKFKNKTHIEIESIEYEIEEIETLKNIYLQRITNNVTEYNNVSKTYSIIDFLQDIESEKVKLLVFKGGENQNITGDFIVGKKDTFLKIKLSYEGKSLRKIYEQVKLNFIALRETGNIDLQKDDWQSKVTTLFVTKELLAFLDNEIENSKCVGLTCKVSENDYDVIYSNYENIADTVLEYYYNSDTGTSYQDFANILTELAREIREQEEWEKAQNQI